MRHRTDRMARGTAVPLVEPWVQAIQPGFCDFQPSIPEPPVEVSRQRIDRSMEGIDRFPRRNESDAQAAEPLARPGGLVWMRRPETSAATELERRVRLGGALRLGRG